MKARKKQFRITIPTSCEVGFQSKAINENERFCQHCQKKVYDFRKHSDAEIERILAGPNAPACGLWLNSQLDRTYSTVDAPTKRSWPRLAMGAMALMLVVPQAPRSHQPWQALDTQSVPEPVNLAALPAPMAPEPEDSMFTLRGNVIDVERGKPFSFCRVFLSDFELDTVADPDGHFEFQLPRAQLTDTLEVTFGAMGGHVMLNVPIDKAAASHDFTAAIRIQMRATMGIMVRVEKD
jgi:hypothetical protein